MTGFFNSSFIYCNLDLIIDIITPIHLLENIDRSTISILATADGSIRPVDSHYLYWRLIYSFHCHGLL